MSHSSLMYSHEELGEALDDARAELDKLTQELYDSKYIATKRKYLLTRCKNEMERSIKDFVENINPYLVAADYHPVTQTPGAMQKLVSELAEELDVAH